MGRVVPAQPVREFQHLGIPPHPCREPAKAVAQLWSRCLVAHIVIDPSGVGPIGLDRHEGEAMPFDQSAGDRVASALEFRRAMGRLAKKDDACVGEPIKDCSEGFGVRRIGNRLRRRLDGRY